jgi:hypothetical protein
VAGVDQHDAAAFTRFDGRLQASQLTTVLLSQLLPSALAPAAATDHSLAIGGEGVGVVGVAGILSPLDGGDAPSGSVQAHSPKKVSTNLSEIGT